MSYRMEHHLRQAVWSLALVLFSSLSPVLAGEASPLDTGIPGNPQADEEVAGHHETEGSVALGYRWLAQKASARAGEYQEPHSSLTGNFAISSYALPHRFSLESAYLSEKNYYGDVGYAYRDLLLARDTFVGLFHNLDHYDYQHAGEAPELRYDDRNVGDRYFSEIYENLLSLRVKAPDFPAHAFLKLRHLSKQGLLQERFLVGDFGDITKTSRSRAIDWQSNALTVGANSHLGPVEMEYSHEASGFDPGKENILHDAYPATSARPADTYPHGVIAETESSANTLKLHTSYTGGLVAALTLGNLAQSNNFSGTESDTWLGAFDLSYLATPNLNFFLRYRHQDLSVDNPAAVTLQGLVNSSTHPVRPAISENRDIVTVSARYRPIPRITLLSSYEFLHGERQDTEQWHILPDETTSNSLALTAHVRPANSLKMKLGASYRLVDNPALNIEPDYSGQMLFSTTYLPVSWITAHADYKRTVTGRDKARYLNNDPDLSVVTGLRDTENDRIFASLSLLLSPRTTLTASYAYFRGRIEQDLAYGKWNNTGTAGDLPYFDTGVPYSDEANCYTISLYLTPREGVSLVASAGYTRSEGDFSPGLSEAQTPVSLASFSPLRVAETTWTVEISKTVATNWDVVFGFFTNRYNDKFDDSQDGRLHITTGSVQRHF